MTLFVDTNFFLQFKSVSEINWDELFDDEIIKIIISRPVQIEIDRLKNDGNSRRAKRARKTNSLFREIIDSPEEKIKFKIGSVTIVLQFSAHVTTNQLKTVQDDLDLNQPDDVILAEVKYYMKNHGSFNDIFFISHDTNPLITAKRNNIPVIMIPDSWLLHSENDARDKELIRLKSQIRELLKKEPIIQTSVTINGACIKDNNHLITVTEFISPNSSEIKDLVERVVIKHPKRVDFSEELKQKFSRGFNPLIKLTYIPPNQEQIENYMHKEYPEWICQMKKYFEDYCNKKNYHQMPIYCDIQVDNIGAKPVENMIIEISVLGGATIYPPDMEDIMKQKSIETYPPPPQEPKGYWKQESAFFDFEQLRTNLQRVDPWLDTNSIFPNSDIPMPKLSPSRDRYTFYWVDENTNSERKTWKLECDEFRHKIGPEPFDLYLRLEEENIEGIVILQINISGSNLIKPFNSVYRVQFAIKKENVYSELIELLK